MTLDNETIERALEGKQPKAAYRRRLLWLVAHARPNNWAWHELDANYGIQGDYTPADEGMHWSDMGRN